MDLKSGYPWWPVRDGLPFAFPRLQKDLRCDVVVVGGGITGALIAHDFASHGYEIAVLEQRDIGWGSTAASTALLQYEIDTPLTDLARRIGEHDAVLAYRACAEAVEALGDIASRMRRIGFQRTDSLYFASRRWHHRRLRTEYALRMQHGFDVAWLGRDQLRAEYDLDAPAALLNRPAAVVDPYMMTCQLMAGLARSGHGVYDRTCVTAVHAYPRHVRLVTGEGLQVTAKHAVLATGYAAQQWIPRRVACNRSSYALVSDPLESGTLGAFTRTVAWETARPYLYFRLTPDRRLMVGGGDDAIDIPARRDRRVFAKAQALLMRMRTLFPDVPIVPAFAWAGTFAETADGLPFFGPHSLHGPRLHFAMAYGGNGITYSVLGAELLRARIERRRHPLAELFSFSRLGVG